MRWSFREFVGCCFVELLIECPIIFYVANGIVFYFKKRYVSLRYIVSCEIQDGPGCRLLVFKLFVCTVFAYKLFAVPG